MDNRRIRIAHLIYNFDVERGGGGITRFVIELCRKLDPDYFDVMIFALWDPITNSEKKNIDALRSQGILVDTLAGWQVSAPYRSFIKATKALSLKTRSEHIEILHSHSEFSDIAALIIKMSLKKIRAIRTVQYGYSFEWRRRPLRRLLLTNFLYPLFFDTEVGVNRSITQTLNQRLIARLRSNQAITIHNGVPLSNFINASEDPNMTRSLLGIPEHSPVVGTVGRLVEQKGHIYFLDAAHLVLQKLPGVYFIIVGDGELEGELKSHAQNLGISQNIVFTGPRTDIPELYACMDLFVSSSLWEGLPNVLLESMASNIPVLATDISGTREVIRHGFNGWLAQPADKVTLAEGMLELLKSPQERQELANNARETVQEFSIERICKQYEAVYKKVTK